MRKFVFFFALVLTVAVRADDTATERLAAEIATRTEGRIEWLLRSEQEVAAKLDSLRGAARKFAPQLEEELRSLRDERTSLQRGDSFDFGMAAPPFTLGEVGRFPARIPVVQVIDETSMLCEILNAIVMVEGISTRGIADDTVVDLKPVVQVTDTVTYDTASGGTNTVFVLRPFDTAPVIRLLRERRAAAESRAEAARIASEAAKAEARRPKPRTWTSVDGAFTTEATFVALSKDGNVVTLVKPDGTTLDVPRQKLSKEDNKYLRER